METLLGSPIFTALIGGAIGYYCKPVVLAVISAALLALAVGITITGDWREIAGVILAIIWMDTLLFCAAMWGMCLLRVGKRREWLQKLKTKILN